MEIPCRSAPESLRDSVIILSCLDWSEFPITGAFQQRPIKHRGQGRKLQGTFRQQETSDTPTGTRLAPPEGPQLPGVGGGAGAPQECACLCRQAHGAHGSSPGTR